MSRDTAALVERSLQAVIGDEVVDDARRPVWDRLIEEGLAHPFQSGAEVWSDGADVVRASGSLAVTIPLADNVAASWLYAQGGRHEPVRRMGLVDPRHTAVQVRNGLAEGHLRQVPHAAVSSLLLVECPEGDGHVLWALELQGVRAEVGTNVGGEPRDELRFDAVPATRILRSQGQWGALAWLGALTRATQMAGCASRALTLCLEHVSTREQFGRPLSRFQAVQQQLAELACEVAALDSAVGVAARAADIASASTLESRAGHAIACAKLQAGRTASTTVRIAHQLHGAMGFTREHSLHGLTRKLMAYRSEHGSERDWAAWLGHRSCRAGADALWHELSRPPGD